MSTWLYSELPGGFFILGVLASLAFIFFGVPLWRYLSEGLAYSVSYSAVWGDVALLIPIAFAGLVARMQGIRVLHLFGVTIDVTSPMFHYVAIALAVVIGVYSWAQKGGHDNQVDGAHNAVVVPVVFYMAVTAVLILLAAGGLLIAIAILPPLMWAFLVYIDTVQKRLQQMAFVQRTGQASILGTRIFVEMLNASGA